MVTIWAINKETKEEKMLGFCDTIAQAQEDIDTITEWDDLDNVSDWDLVIRKEVKEMEKEIFDSCANCPYSCENCPYDENGWCCCEGDLPDDALCMEGYEDD